MLQLRTGNAYPAMAPPAGEPFYARVAPPETFMHGRMQIAPGYYDNFFEDHDDDFVVKPERF